MPVTEPVLAPGPGMSWDPLATDIETDQDGYITFQQSLADAVLKCLPEDAK